MHKPPTRVPAELHERYREIVALTDRFCAEYMNDEYRDLCRACAADACAEGVPVQGGKAAGWAAGVVSAVAYANFLGSDPSQPFHMSPVDMASRTGVSPATLQNKSKAIRDALGIDRFDPRYTSRKLAEKNPLSTMMAMFEQILQREPAPSRPRSTRKGKKEKRGKAAGPARVYTLDVSLLTGPVTEAFAKKNPSVVRTIEIRGDQTLDDLHEAIFDAFDRDDPHMYEFQFGKGPMDPKGPRYVMPEVADDDSGPPVAGITTETTIDDLGLTTDSQFGYWFDFGDDWFHQIDVAAIDEAPGKGKYPRVTKKIGKSPPQYADSDEE